MNSSTQNDATHNLLSASALAIVTIKTIVEQNAKLYEALIMTTKSANEQEPLKPEDRVLISDISVHNHNNGNDALALIEQLQNSIDTLTEQLSDQPTPN